MRNLERDMKDEKVWDSLIRPLSRKLLKVEIEIQIKIENEKLEMRNFERETRD